MQQADPGVAPPSRSCDASGVDLDLKGYLFGRAPTTPLERLLQDLGIPPSEQPETRIIADLGLATCEELLHRPPGEGCVVDRVYEGTSTIQVTWYRDEAWERHPRLRDGAWRIPRRATAFERRPVTGWQVEDSLPARDLPVVAYRVQCSSKPSLQLGRESGRGRWPDPEELAPLLGPLIGACRALDRLEQVGQLDLPPVPESYALRVCDVLEQ